MRKIMNLKKIISIFTLLCFGAQSVFAAFSAVPQAISAAKADELLQTAFALPANYGKITKISDAQSKNIVVNVQDLHSHPQVQRNIAKIIEYLDKNYKVSGIFTEGASGEIDLSWLSGISDDSFKNSLTEKLLGGGRLNASEYFALKNDKTALLYGLEDGQKHRQNIMRLGHILSRQNDYEKVLRQTKEQLDFLNFKYLNAKNKRFNQVLEKYRSGAISTEKFYVLLSKYAKALNENPQNYNYPLPVNFEDYTNINSYLYLQKLDGKINRGSASAGLRSAVSYLKEKLPYARYKKFLDDTENLSNIYSTAYHLSAVCEEYGVNIESLSRHTAMFLKAREISSKLNPVELLNEERDLTQKLRQSFSSDETEYEISFLADFYGLFSNYLTNSLMPQDFEYFASGLGEFLRLYSKYNPVNFIDAISADFKLIGDYYNLNNERNEIFSDIILKNSKADFTAKTGRAQNASDCLKNADSVIIAVTGGYHSLGLSEILAQKGITCITVTPSVFDGTKQAKDAYDAVIKRQSAFLRQALSFIIAAQAPADEKFEFICGALNGLPFSDDGKNPYKTFDLLAETLRSCLGPENVTAEYGENSASAVFNGVKITLVKDKDGKIVVQTPDFSEKREQGGFNFSREQKIKIRNLTEKVFELLPSKGGLSFFNPDLEKFIPEILSFAVGQNLFENYGLSYFANDYFAQNPQKSVYGLNKNDFAKLPEYMQDLLLGAKSGLRETSLPPPAQLQLKPLGQIYRFLKITDTLTQVKITSFVETPLVLLSVLFPAFAKIFLSWHKNLDKGLDEKTREERQRIREYGLREIIIESVKEAYNETVFETSGSDLTVKLMFNISKIIKNPVVKKAVFATAKIILTPIVKIARAVRANYDAHIYANLSERFKFENTPEIMSNLPASSMIQRIGYVNGRGSYDKLTERTGNDSMIASSLKSLKGSEVNWLIKNKIISLKQYEYYKIIAIRKDDSALKKITGGESDAGYKSAGLLSEDILHLKLFALMYLKANGNREEFPDILDEFKNTASKKEPVISDDFDLRAVLCGVHSLLLSKSGENLAGRDALFFYDISQAAIAHDYKRAGLDAETLVFKTAPNLDEIAHTLGLQYFNGFTQRSAFEEMPYFCETFAFANALVLNRILGKKTDAEKLKAAFTDKDDAIFQKPAKQFLANMQKAFKALNSEDSLYLLPAAIAEFTLNSSEFSSEDNSLYDIFEKLVRHQANAFQKAHNMAPDTFIKEYKRAEFENRFAGIALDWLPGIKHKSNMSGFKDFTFSKRYLRALFFIKQYKLLTPSVPKIDEHAAMTTYRNDFNRYIKEIADRLSRLNDGEKKLAETKSEFSEDEFKYLSILLMSEKELKQTLLDKNQKILFRLFAFLTLQYGFPNYNDPEINSVKFGLALDSFAYIQETSQSVVKNNFDLRALITGIHLIMTHYSNRISQYSETDEQKLYGTIFTAVQGKEGKDSIANAALLFFSYTFSSVSHELGHNYLYDFAPNLTALDSIARKAAHEFFAYLASKLFTQITGQDKENYNISDKKFRLFIPSDKEFKEQEEHESARGMHAYLGIAFSGINKFLDYDLLAGAAADFLQNVFDKNDSSEAMFKKFIDFYSDILAKNLGVTKDELLNDFKNAEERIVSKQYAKLNPQRIEIKADMLWVLKRSYSILFSLYSKKSVLIRWALPITSLLLYLMKSKRVEKMFSSDGQTVLCYKTTPENIEKIMEENASRSQNFNDSPTVCPVYFLNKKPLNDAGYNFKNAAINISGKPVWRGKYKGALVIFSEEADFSVLLEAVMSNQYLKGEISISYGAKTNKLLKGRKTWIEIDDVTPDTRHGYSQNGNTHIGHGLFAELLKYSDLANLAASFNKLKKSESRALAQGLIHFLDDVNLPAQFIQYLNQHQKIGNGQIMLTGDFMEKLTDAIGIEKVSEFLNSAAKDGVQVYVSFDDYYYAKTFEKQLKKAGFAGYSYTKNNRVYIYNFDLKSETEMPAINFNDYGSLERALKESKGFGILKNSNLKRVITYERNGIFINKITEALSVSRILQILSDIPLDAGAARRAAMNFNIEDMPELTEPARQILSEALADDNITTEEFSAFTSFNPAHPISIYLSKLELQTGGEKIINAFLAGITERILTADALAKAGKKQGLKDKKLEIVLGRALIKQIKEKTASYGNDIAPESLGATVKGVENGLYLKLDELTDDAFINGSPKAVNALAELIPAIAEGREKDMSQSLRPQMDIRNYKKILTAA
jgi:hypothetical protein